MSGQLESLQRTFAEALDDPANEPSLLAHAKPAPPVSAFAAARVNGSATTDMTPFIVEDVDDTIRRRVALYRGNVRARWRAALANAYPVLLALVGEAYFDALSLAYARAHPSQSGDLNCFGDALPTFIGEYEGDLRYRYFADVARLEWAVYLACTAADVMPLTRQQWLEIGVERLLDLQLVVNPACAAIASRYAIADIWLAHQPGGVIPQHIDVPSWTLVVRPL